LFVYKFRSHGQLYLLGYTLDDGVQLVYLEAIGPHENFYCDLKLQLAFCPAIPPTINIQMKIPFRVAR
jgi:hypothetical protein